VHAVQHLDLIVCVVKTLSEEPFLREAGHACTQTQLGAVVRKTDAQHVHDGALKKLPETTNVAFAAPATHRRFTHGTGSSCMVLWRA